MTTAEFDAFINNILQNDKFTSSDRALNGIQVDNDGSAIKKVAFAVDAAMESFEQAAAIKADILFVHHGLFWGNSEAITGNLRRRVKFLLDHNICLYAAHLPLDQHPYMGNNACIAKLLGLESLEPFGTYHGQKIGYKGTFPKPITTETAVKKISFMGRPPLGVYNFGKKENTTAAIVSGGGAVNAREAIAEGVDLFITGDNSHQIYHDCLEGKLNLIAGGHYSTEVWGLQALMKHCIENGIDAEFIDIPTAL